MFSKLDGSLLQCQKGDSGGVVFSGGLACGWYQGQVTSGSGSTADDCNFLFYMTSDYVGRIGGSILVRP